jgi:hypothetical protein
VTGSARHRVHVYEMGGSNRWLASADFARQPDRQEINEALAPLQGPGWFEVRLARLSGADEIPIAAWTQQDGTPGRKP